MADRGRMSLLEYIRMKESSPLESDDIAQIKEFAKWEEDYIKMLVEDNALLEQKNRDLQTNLSHLREEVELLADERGETRKMIRQELDNSIPVIVERVVHQLGIRLNYTTNPRQTMDIGDDGSKGRSMEGETHASLVSGSVADGVLPVRSVSRSSQELCTLQNPPTAVSVPPMSNEGLVSTSPPNPSNPSHLSHPSHPIKDSTTLENVNGNEPGLDLMDAQTTLFSEMEILAVDHLQHCDPPYPSNVIDDLQNMQAKMDAELKNRELAIRELEMEDDDDDF